MLYQQPHGTRGGWEEGFDRNTAEGKGQKERCEEARRSGEETRCTEREGTSSGLDSRLGHRLGPQGSEAVLVAHQGLEAGLWLGKQAGGGHPGGKAGGGGRGCSDRTEELLPGARQGEEQRPRFHRVTRRRREAGQSPGSLCARSPPAGRGDCAGRGRSTQDAQHQQVFEEFSGPSGLPSSSSSSARASSLLAGVRRSSSSFLWACSTSSVRRVKDWESKERN